MESSIVPGVASRRDAWIETPGFASYEKNVKSHPAGMRGLKPWHQVPVDLLLWVASRRDAWIETPLRPLIFISSPVASRRDAWIETALGRRPDNTA